MSKYEDKEKELMEKAQKEKLKKDLEKIAKPSLIKRIASQLLDLIMIVTLGAILFVGAYYTTLKSSGYFNDLDKIYTIYKESGLFNEVSSVDYEDLEYDATKYEYVISNYYQNDSYASTTEAYDNYLNAKSNMSAVFELDTNGNYVIKEDATEANIKAFYTTQYEKAIKVLMSNPEYNNASYHSLLQLTLTILSCATISSLVFYLIIPLCRKEGETVGQIICKICLLNTKNNKQVTKKQIVVRYLVILIFDIAGSAVLFFKWGVSAFIPPLISLVCMCLTKENRSIHEYISNTVVIQKSRFDMVMGLKNMTGSNGGNNS